MIKVIEMGGNWYEKSVPAHLYSETLSSWKHLVTNSGLGQTPPQKKKLLAIIATEFLRPNDPFTQPTPKH